MVTVSEVVHGFELLVDDPDAGLVCSVHDALDVFRRLAQCGKLLVQALSSLDSSLRVEFSWF